MANLKPAYVDLASGELVEPRNNDKLINDPDVTVDSITELQESNISKSIYLRTKTLKLLGYNEPGDGGGGTVYWDADMDRQNHNAIRVLSPTHNNSAWGDIDDENWFEPDLDDEGTGCWVRPFGEYIDLRQAGISDSETDKGKAFNKIAEVAANNGYKVWVPNKTYYIDAAGDHVFRPPSNSYWEFHPDAKIKAIPNDSGNYAIIGFHSIDNATFLFNGATVEGERDDHLGSEGEQGKCISIRQASNIYIDRPVVTDAWGDGLYLGGNPDTYNEHIVIRGLVADNNRRQGISLITGQDIYIINPILKNTGGTPPGAGIDIEPNDALQRAVNINIINPKTYNNEGGGITVNPASLDETSMPISVTIENHEEDGNGNSPRGLTVRASTSDIDGYVKVIDPLYKNCRNNAFIAREWAAHGPHCTLFYPVAIDCNQGEGDSNNFNSAYSIFNDSEETQPVGGVTLIEPEIVSTDDQFLPVHGIRSNNNDTTNVENLFIIDPKNLPCNGNPIDIDLGADYYFSDKYGVAVETVSETTDEFRRDAVSKRIVSGISSGDIFRFSAEETIISNRETTIEMHDETLFQITSSLGSPDLLFYPDKERRLFTNSKGSKITVKRQDGGYWITNRVGSWSIIHNIEDGESTPDVRGRKVIETNNNNPTTITDFIGGVIAQEITVLFNDSNTTVDFTDTNLEGNEGADWSPSEGDHMTCVYDNDTWHCSISDNTS